MVGAWNFEKQLTSGFCGGFRDYNQLPLPHLCSGTCAIDANMLQWILSLSKIFIRVASTFEDPRLWKDPLRGSLLIFGQGLRQLWSARKTKERWPFVRLPWITTVGILDKFSVFEPLKQGRRIAATRCARQIHFFSDSDWLALVVSCYYRWSWWVCQKNKTRKQKDGNSFTSTFAPNTKAGVSLLAVDIHDHAVE